MLKIRLTRKGTKKRPYYHIVVADSRYPRDGRFIEQVGSYNPMVAKDSPARLQMNLESIKAWIAKGAQATDRVAKFLSNAGVMEARTIHPQTKQDKPKAKTVARTNEKAAKIAEIEAAKKQAEIDAKAAAEAAKQAEVEAKAATEAENADAIEAVEVATEQQDTVTEMSMEAGAEKEKIEADEKAAE